MHRWQWDRTEVSEDVDLEVTSSSVARFIHSKIRDVIETRKEGLSRDVVVDFGHLHTPQIIHELGFIPSHYGGCVPRDHPQISWTVQDLRRHLVHLQDPTVISCVSWWTDSLSTLSWRHSLYRSMNDIIPCPSEKETRVDDRCMLARSELGWDLKQCIQGSVPHIHSRDPSKEP